MYHTEQTYALQAIEYISFRVSEVILCRENLPPPGENAYSLKGKRKYTIYFIMITDLRPAGKHISARGSEVRLYYENSPPSGEKA